MADITWKKEYSCNIRAVDDDHKNLFEVIDRLDDHIKEGSDESIITATIESLILYVNEHFDREERFMRSANYPDYRAHKEQHQQFTQNIYALRELFEEDPNQIKPEKVLTYLTSWLVSHIQSVDTDYIPFVNGERQGDPDISAEYTPVEITIRCTPEKQETITRLLNEINLENKDADRLTSEIERLIRDRKVQSKKSALELFGH